MAVILHTDKICESLEKRIRRDLKSLGKICLASVLIGEDTSKYYKSQKAQAAKFDIDFPVISPPASFPDFKSTIKKLNNDRKVTGIIINKPFLPGWREGDVFSLLDPDKDVEGMHPLNLGKFFMGENKYLSPTVSSIIKLLDQTKIALRGKRVTIVGFSALIGKPLALFLANEIATVTIVHKKSRREDLPFYVSNADILISAAGAPGLIKGEWIKPKAVVIDVSTALKKGKISGDVEFAAAKKRASFITPVPGGVGKLTTLCLFENLVFLARLKQKTSR